MDSAHRAKGGNCAFWIVESVQQFAEEVRLGAKEWGDLPLATIDFEEIYTSSCNCRPYSDRVCAIGSHSACDGIPKTRLLSKSGWVACG